MTDKVCPPLGTGSVDFNALNDAAAAGDDLKEALAAATTGGEPEIADSTVPIEPLASLSGLNKAELIRVADSENVDADATMTNADIITAIEAKRSAGDEFAEDYVAPLGPVSADGSDEPTD